MFLGHGRVVAVRTGVDSTGCKTSGFGVVVTVASGRSDSSVDSSEVPEGLALNGDTSGNSVFSLWGPELP